MLLIFLVSGCSSGRPVLYPNAHYRKVGPDKAKLDVEQAMKTAEQQDLSSGSAGNRALGRSMTNTAVSGGAGVAADAVSGGVGAGSAIRAGGAGAVSLFSWMFSSGKPDPLYQRFVELQLKEKGYQVIGWK
jgi:hypothetical protein